MLRQFLFISLCSLLFFTHSLYASHCHDNRCNDIRVGIGVYYDNINILNTSHNNTGGYASLF
ncbi:hypothetical protein [Helicobacter didelphidarum]|uniref:hypothetical protein n=1 Tax=Helicobacter didelphidarum TaxID=2040648 RepID=UPI0011C05AA0|nr:hypothetical protein [Helicobacter didelphidarum]